jgi:HEAT repeat protein
MQRIEAIELNINLKNLPDKVMDQVLGLLDDKNFKRKHEARKKLVHMGTSIIPQMHKLLSSGNSFLRMEVTKVVQLISDKRSIPLFICLLEDAESDIRWIAAEGLINIGRQCIHQLLGSIRDNKNPNFLYREAHHVLNSLMTDTEKKTYRPLLLSLDNYLQLGETAPYEAFKAMKTPFR